ncbi:phage portal protein [Lysinibacillus sphaericus]|uniref:Phage portal protein n=1 Tax=Lysinibacillus sphaericus OT4b.31 TaxID=1285586 RepID=R7Z8G8_LYSSH|nr:phage portal protein [Lysinibacillus sphaericus]EON70465.1 Phage portal protein [Lysinibacillus sphaericus OT4b.31]
MGFLDLFKTKEVVEERSQTLEEVLLEAGLLTNNISKTQALSIPSFSANIELIASTIASISVQLYTEADGKVTEVNDYRNVLLNDETGDTLNSYEFKKALVIDYLIDGEGFAYINRDRNKIKSLHYVDSDRVSVFKNTDAIYKSIDILVDGKTYRDFEFIKILRNTKDGATGIGLLKQNNKLLSVAYNSLMFEESLLKKGGNKKGFLQSQNKLSEESMTALKEGWNRLYQNDKENVMILNEGLTFQESSATSVELQLNENKVTNATEISKMCNVPNNILNGTASKDEYKLFIKMTILPILKAFETVFNKDLLLPSEKSESFYFAFDTAELLKGDTEDRYKAYSEAIKGGWMSKNEVRYREDLAPIEGLDVVTMSLGDVIFDINTGKYFTPNMDSTNNMKDSKGGENVEN